MEKIDSCTDCFWCKINRSKGYIRCACKDNSGMHLLYWVRSDGNEKIIKLMQSEIKKSFIKWRDLFSMAKTCPSVKSMI